MFFPYTLHFYTLRQRVIREQSATLTAHLTVPVCYRTKYRSIGALPIHIGDTIMGIQLGSYVTHNSDTYIVSCVNGTDVKLTNQYGLLSGSKYNLIPMAECKPLSYLRAVRVKHNGKYYLHTTKGMIISLVSCKPMKWDARNGNRTNINAAAAMTRFKQREACKKPVGVKPPCPRCGGTRFIHTYAHRDGGVCYLCR